MISLQNQIEAFEYLFAEYIKYLEIDLANSLINKTKFARNVHLLNDFRNLFSYALNPKYVESEKFQQRKKDMTESVEEYCSNAKHIIELKGNIHIDAGLIQEIILSNGVFIKKHIEFYFSNIAFSDAFKKSLINKNDFKDYGLLNPKENKKEYVFVQSLLEFNNALSHLVMAVCKKHKETKEQNIKSAMHHFYRATLDNYKIIIRFSMHKAQFNEYIQSFLSIRKGEFFLLGKDIQNRKIDFYNPVKKRLEQDKNILNAYKELFEAIRDLNLKQP